MKRVLVDTNSYSLFRAGDNKIKKQLTSADEIVVPVIVIGELYSGFYQGNKLEENKSHLASFLGDSRVVVAKLTKETGVIYGKILSELFAKGNPIPTNDIWIAACALQTDSIVITYDKHFLKIPKVKVWKNLK